MNVDQVPGTLLCWGQVEVSKRGLGTEEDKKAREAQQRRQRLNSSGAESKVTFKENYEFLHDDGMI